ncbi:zinc finger protein PLAG1 [Gadus macrocephalus]|uniref:zinc finger protein PLAG1 n=1 Tax=Gadus macrocephalus TaxID=80720 RepID=UPI0028CB40A1|nr:zinc finger protein PLAG1 [Gadus macrocephalus]
MATGPQEPRPHVLEKAKLMPATGRRRRAEGKPKKNFPCQVCQKAFNSVEKLKVHSYSHTGERPYRCSHPECTKAFVSKYKLLRHTATHSPEKNHKCSYCEKMFHRKDHLKNHLHTHDPYKEAFACPQCGKSYNTKLGFKRHLALHAAHSGDLTCQVCLQPYASTAVLLEHLKTHAGKSSNGAKEKKHRCEHCERRFYTRKDVRRHMVVHTGRKDFLCQYCAQRFGRKDHLTRHVKKSHARELLRVKTEPADSLETFVCDLAPQLAGFKGELSPPPAAPLPRPLQLNMYAAAAAAGAAPGLDPEPFPGPMHPFSLKYPLGQPSFTSYGAMSVAQEREQSLKGELETYLMELQSAMPSSSSASSAAASASASASATQLSVSKLELGPQGLAEEGGEASSMSKMPTSGPALGAMAGEALASSSSLLDFSQLFNFLPLHGPPYHPAGAGPAVTLGAPYPPAHEPAALVRSPEGPEGPEAREGALQGLPASFISNLSAPTTLPRFHQAFQ